MSASYNNNSNSNSDDEDDDVVNQFVQALPPVAQIPRRGRSVNRFALPSLHENIESNASGNLFEDLGIANDTHTRILNMITTTKYDPEFFSQDEDMLGDKIFALVTVAKTPTQLKLSWLYMAIAAAFNFDLQKTVNNLIDHIFFDMIEGLDFLYYVGEHQTLSNLLERIWIHVQSYDDTDTYLNTYLVAKRKSDSRKRIRQEAADALKNAMDSRNTKFVMNASLAIGGMMFAFSVLSMIGVEGEFWQKRNLQIDDSSDYPYSPPFPNWYSSVRQNQGNPVTLLLQYPGDFIQSVLAGGRVCYWLIKDIALTPVVQCIVGPVSAVMKQKHDLLQQSLFSFMFDAAVTGALIGLAVFKKQLSAPAARQPPRNNEDEDIPPPIL